MKKIIGNKLDKNSEKSCFFKYFVKISNKYFHKLPFDDIIIAKKGRSIVMLRFITCDDNTEALEKSVLAITKIMMPYDIDYKINKFTRYNEELEKIIKAPGEQKIYILDVELPKVSGLEIASEIRENGDWESMIIFVSAHPECKDDIFFSRLLALDFISKYFNYEQRLEETLLKVLEIYNLNNMLTFSFDYVTYRIPINKILYIEKQTSNKKCLIVMESGEQFEVVSTLKKLLTKLNSDFYRSHKSCIVNTRKIYKVDYIDNLITFYNDVQTNLLSARNKKGLKQYGGFEDF